MPPLAVERSLTIHKTINHKTLDKIEFIALYLQLAEGAHIDGQKRNLVWGPNFTRARS
jgi:hypothetical protein